MKSKLFLVCCGVLALGSGCATYDSGGTADDAVVVTGSGYRDYSYYDYNEPYAPHPHYYLDPHRGAAMWKQPSPNGQDWTDNRPEFHFWAR